MKYLVTGAAGFIGAKVSERLCLLGHEVIGIDNLNDYYDVNLKLARLDLLQTLDNFHFIKLDLADREGIAALLHGMHSNVLSILRLKQVCVTRSTIR